VTEVERPIVVACMGRSGSSMVTGILHEHGAWVGKCQGPDPKRNPKGYYENVAIKRHAEAYVSRPRIMGVHDPIPGWHGFVKATIRREGYEGGPWVVKHFAAFYKSWLSFSPKWVLPRRDDDAIMRSTRRAGFWKWASDDQLRSAIRVHQQALDHLRDYHGGVEVYSDDVVNGDRSSLRAAVNSTGLKYDDETAKKFIEPSYWDRG